MIGFSESARNRIKDRKGLEEGEVAPTWIRPHRRLPIEMRARLLYNPDLESSHFFVPGLVGIILQLVALFLTSFAIVRGSPFFPAPEQETLLFNI